jgi:hypothetical protein
MSTAIEIPLRTLTPAVVRDLQDKYPEAVVRIEVEDAVSATEIDENRFWSIIALLDWGRRDNADIVAPAIEALSKYSEAGIFRFEDILASKLFALDGETFAEALGWNSQDNDGFSSDVFLYARCCVVANGGRFYEKVLSDPSQMPRDCTFEPLLYIAEKAYRLKTGLNTYDYLPKTSYETFNNHAAWPGMPSLHELIRNDRNEASR